MKAALLREYHRPLELVDRPRPEVAHPSDVLVRIGGAGVCATDLHAIEGLMEPAGVTLPRVLGHENAGWVEELGDAVSTVAKGDAVLVYPPYSCGLCVACRRGNDMHCARHEFTGLSVDGGFAEYVLVSERSLVRLPAGVEPAAVAPHSDAGLTAYHAVKRLAHLAVPGSTAVIIGVGGVGHIALQLVRELGSSSVIAVDTDERRRRLATELGADEVVERADAVREVTDGRGADLVFDFVGTDQTHADSAAMLARGGTYSVIGYGGTISIASPALVVNEHAVVGNLVGTWIDLWELLQLHAAGRVTLKTETHPLDSVNEVLEKLRDGEVTGRAVLVPEEGSATSAASAPRHLGRVDVAEEIRRAKELGLVLEPLRRAVVADPAAFEHVGVLGEPERDVRELLDQQDADAARGSGLQRRDEPLDDDGREAERELVDEQDPRLRHERLREHDHLLLAAGEQPGQAGPPFLELRKELQRVLDPARRVRPAEGIRRDAQVVLRPSAPGGGAVPRGRLRRRRCAPARAGGP